MKYLDDKMSNDRGSTRTPVAEGTHRTSLVFDRGIHEHAIG